MYLPYLDCGPSSMSRDRLEPGSILIPAFSPQRKPWNSRSFAGLGRQGERDGQRRLHGVRVQVGDQQEGDECVSWAPGFDGEHGMVGGLHGDAGQLQGATDEQGRTRAGGSLGWQPTCWPEVAKTSFPLRLRAYLVRSVTSSTATYQMLWISTTACLPVR